MGIRKVQAVFDNGTTRILPSRLLLADDSTVEDAVAAFSTNHPSLWKVSSVELVGFISTADLQNREAPVWLAPPSCKLKDMLEPTDYLVFRSSRSMDTLVSLHVGDKVNSSAAKPQGVGRREPPANQKDDNKEENDYGFTVSRKKAPVARNSKTCARIGSRPNERQTVGQSSELRGLQDSLVPPTAVNGTRTRKLTRPSSPRLFDAPTTGMVSTNKRSSTGHEDRRQKKQARTDSKVARKTGSKAASHSRSEVKTFHEVQSMSAGRENGLQRNDRGLSDGQLPHSHEPGTLVVLSSQRIYFAKDNETPLKISNKFGVPVRRIVNDNRPMHPTLNQKSRLRPFTRIVLPTVEEAKRERQEELLYGERTPWQGPFPYCGEPGTLILQPFRRVYVSKNDDTPMRIGKKFGVSAGKIVYDNRLMHPLLKQNSRLKPFTRIVLPLDDVVGVKRECGIPTEIVVKRGRAIGSAEMSSGKSRVSREVPDLPTSAPISTAKSTFGDHVAPTAL